MWGYDWEEAWTPWDGLVPSPTRPRLTHVCVNWCVQGRRLFFYLPAAASVIFFCGSIPVYHLKLNGPTTKISRVTPTKPNGKGKIRGKKNLHGNMEGLTRGKRWVITCCRWSTWKLAAGKEISSFIFLISSSTEFPFTTDNYCFAIMQLFKSGNIHTQ